MKLSGALVRRIHDAILDGYRRKEELSQMVRFELDENLDVIAGGDNLSAVVTALIDWAERSDRVDDLVRGAHNQNPGNSLLGQLLEECRHWLGDSVKPHESTAVNEPRSNTVVSGSGAVATSGGVAAGAGGIAIGGDVAGDVVVNFGETESSPAVNRRAVELAYLDDVIGQQENWAKVFTPLGATVYKTKTTANDGPQLNAPLDLMNPEFELLVKRPTGDVERVEVADVRDAIRDHRRLVVLGEPGSGKSTTLRRLAHEYAQAAKMNEDAPLPIYVELGRYSGPQAAVDYVAGSFGGLAPYLTDYMARRRVVLLLDGLNEMPRKDFAGRVGRIQVLLNRATDLIAVVTCRELDYVEELLLEQLNIKPLDVNQQRTYLHRYLGEQEGEALFWQLVGGNDAIALWQAWQQAGGTWEQFWSWQELPDNIRWKLPVHLRESWQELKDENRSKLLDLGANPYMLVMFARVFSGQGLLPQNRASLFAAFAATLFERERKRHPDASWPENQPLCDALGRLAFAMQEAGERGTAVAKSWALTQLDRDEDRAAELLYMVISATLLVESNGEVRFVHQLLQEYFAAWTWQQRMPNDDLSRYWPDGWVEPSDWDETAILLAGSLEDMTEWVNGLLYANPVLAARCIAESGGVCPADATVDTLRDHLTALAIAPEKPVKQRNAAGNALNDVEDTRRGVGLRPDGVPDIEWCEVPAGEFLMGNTKQTDAKARGNESPQKSIYLPRFRISKYLVTNAQYAAFVRDGGYSERHRLCWTEAGWNWRRRESIDEPRRSRRVFSLLNHPVVGVSWHEAMAFCAWLSDRLGHAVGLPTEAEWEKAARGKEGRRYPWGDEITPERLNFSETNIGATSAVGIFPNGASPYGLTDVAGNVWEWTSSLRQDYPYDADDGREDPQAGGARTLRGGSWDFDVNDVRCALRDFSGFPGSSNDNLGCRVVSPGF